VLDSAALHGERELAFRNLQLPIDLVAADVRSAFTFLVDDALRLTVLDVGDNVVASDSREPSIDEERAKMLFDLSRDLVGRLLLIHLEVLITKWVASKYVSSAFLMIGRLWRRASLR
jgi:hypothetical protein